MIMFAMAAALAAMPSSAAPSATARAQADAPVAAPTAKARKQTQYCVNHNLTGSRIPVRECHSRADWLAQGFDPLATSK
jgi:hypothetical protein